MLGLKALRFVSAFIASAAPSVAAARQAVPAPQATVIHCGTLLAAPGQAPIQGATIVVRDGRIESVTPGFVPPDRAAPGGDGAFIDLSAKFVMPGLIDCHTHMTMEISRESRLRNVEESDADAAVRGVAYSWRTLMAGFTTVRNLGSSGDAAFALRDAILRGDIVGPRILEAGESISPTGGHSDHTHGYREDLFEMPAAMQGVADGADECRKAVRAQVKRGADVIKMTATGGVLSATAAGTEQQLFEDELLSIVETAHLLNRKVAAHAHGTNGIKAALRAGVDSIEHGTFLDDEAIDLFKETGAYYVPTLHAGWTVAELAKVEGYFVPAVREKAARTGPVMKDAFRRAHAAGVRIAFGTDCGVGVHGDNAREFVLMTEAGMSPMEALVTATVNAADLCGLSAEIGSIEKGKAADIIATDGSPLEDISQMQRVTFVMRAGRAHKGL